MSLFKDWNDMVVDYVKTQGERAFWAEYSDVEGRIYTRILAEKSESCTLVIADMAKELETTPEFVMGFVDGINDSLRTPLDLEEVTAEETLRLDMDFEKLYYNMVDAKADYLYNIPTWAELLPKEKREALMKQAKEAKTVRNESKVGRNDPCPCGSGKKYKKCCGKAS